MNQTIADSPDETVSIYAFIRFYIDEIVWDIYNW